MVYCEAKRIIEAYENKQGSIQSLISQSQCQHKKSLTCLILKSISYKKLLKKIIKKSSLLEREKFMGEKLAQLLVYDVLFGMGVRGKFRSAMKRNYAQLETALDYYMKKYECSTREQLLNVFDSLAAVKKPKYIYINRLVSRKKHTLAKLDEEGFELVEFGDDVDEENFRNTIQELSENQFVKDFHVKNLYVFKSDSRLNKDHHQKLFNEGLLIQIDKSSCLVPMALNPPPESHIIDAASAPGNKTILLSNMMKNTGLIHAFDISETRVEMMRGNLKQHGVTNVRLKCMDFLATDGAQYDRVQAIVLDVPCSGSGMSVRLRFGDADLENNAGDDSLAGRLGRLEALQRKMLLHGLMNFENVTRVVYSTCSVNKEENENVVRFALNNCEKRFHLVNVFEECKSFGRGICESAEDEANHIEYCIRLSLTANATNGFFIAVFERNADEIIE